MKSEHEKADGTTNTDGSNKTDTNFYKKTLTDQPCPSYFSVFGGFSMPVELAFKTTLLTSDEAKFFYKILQEVAFNFGEPCHILTDQIEASTGLDEKNQRKARASLWMQDLIRYSAVYDHINEREDFIYYVPGSEKIWK